MINRHNCVYILNTKHSWLKNDLQFTIIKISLQNSDTIFVKMIFFFKFWQRQ